MCSAPFRHDGATGPVIFNVFTTPSPTAAAIFASLRLDDPQLRRPGRRFRGHAQHSVAQCGRGRVLGDAHRPPPATGRTPRLRPPAATSRASSPRRGRCCRAAADRGRPGPGRTSGGDFPRRRRGGWAAGDGPALHLCLGCAPRREPLPTHAAPGPSPAARSIAPAARRRTSRRDPSGLYLDTGPLSPSCSAMVIRVASSRGGRRRGPPPSPAPALLTPRPRPVPRGGPRRVRRRRHR